MTQEIKYTHEELVEAVQRVQDLGDFDKEVDASKKAGEILNEALDAMEKTVFEGVSNLGGSQESVESGFDKGDEFGL